MKALRYAAVVAITIAGCNGNDKPADPKPAPAPGSAQPAPAADTTPIEISIVYGSEKKSWLDEQIAAFHKTSPKLRSRPIRITGTPMGSGEAMAAILDGKHKP